MEKTREFQSLLYAIAQDGCSLCRLGQDSVDRYLDSWKYEHFTDVGVRQELRRTQGFCNLHTWQLAHLGAVLQLAQAYRDIITDSIEQLRGGSSDSPSPGAGLLRRLFDSRRDRPDCPACRLKQLAEERYAHTLCKALLDPVFYDQFAVSHGLCLDHFRLTCSLKAPDIPGDWLTLLRKAQLSCLEQLDEQLVELIRKHDYRFKDEQRGPEMLSWKKAASMVAGEEIHL